MQSSIERSFIILKEPLIFVIFESQAIPVIQPTRSPEMSDRIFPICALVIIVLCLSAGCSSDSGNAVLTNADVTSGQAAVSPTLVPWGYYDISIDTRTWVTDILPLRTAEYTVDAVMFLQPPGGNSANLKILVTNVDNWFTEGKITVEVTLVHPFPGLNQYTGHDVTGVLMSGGVVDGKYDTSVSYPYGFDAGTLLNADGFTRWMNPHEFAPDGTFFNFIPGKLSGSPLGFFTATINGYKYYADGIDAYESVSSYYSNPTHVNKRGQFRAGAANTREFQLKFPVDGAPVLNFQYAVVAHWVDPGVVNPNDIPGSFPVSANADEAIFAKVVADNSTLWFDTDHGGGDINFDLEIYDWGGRYNQFGVMGEVADIIVEFDDLASNPLPTDYAAFPSGTLTWLPGSTSFSSVVTIDIPDCAPHSLNPINMLITIESSDPTTFDPGTGFPPTDATLASYFFYDGFFKDDQEPTQPQGTQVTDLSLKANRIAGGTAIESLELMWTDTGDPQYAVYRDQDPYDNGGIFAFEPDPIALVNGSPAVINDFDGNGEYAFTVRSRSIADDPATESVDSNYAFIEMENGGDSVDTGNWTIGGNSNMAARMMFQRGASFGNGGWGWFVDNGYWANTCAQLWSALCSPQIPEISTATEAFIEYAHWYYLCWQPGTFPGCDYPNNYPGFHAGGATTQAPPPQTQYDLFTWQEYDIFYNNPDDPPGGLGDECFIIDQNNPSITYFYGTPTVGAVWNGTDQTWKMSRLNCNLTDSNFDYAAVATGANSFLNNNTADEGHFYTDDICVIVY